MATYDTFTRTIHGCNVYYAKGKVITIQYSNDDGILETIDNPTNDILKFIEIYGFNSSVMMSVLSLDVVKTEECKCKFSDEYSVYFPECNDDTWYIC
jgi:hypothetical protein